MYRHSSGRWRRPCFEYGITSFFSLFRETAKPATVQEVPLSLSLLYFRSRAASSSYMDAKGGRQRRSRRRRRRKKGTEDAWSGRPPGRNGRNGPATFHAEILFLFPSLFPSQVLSPSLFSLSLPPAESHLWRTSEWKRRSLTPSEGSVGGVITAAIQLRVRLLNSADDAVATSATTAAATTATGVAAKAIAAASHML